MAERIGLDVSGESYWRDKTATYLQKFQGPYHEHRLGMVQRLLEGVPTNPDGIIDFGCGDGIMLEPFVGSSDSLIGIDIDPDMISAAGQRLGQGASLLIGGVDRLQELPPASADLILSLNVNAYLSLEEDVRFYEEASRVLRPNGTLVLTHSNRLFDLYSLNGFTAAFVAEELCQEDNQLAKVSSLLVNAARFKEDPTSGHFPVRENPLSYATKLARYGFHQQQQEFANLHPMPPALMAGTDFQDINSRTYSETLDWPETDRWKLMFICSMFGARAVRK